MRAVLFVCSESSALDAQTNRVSLFHITDHFAIAGAPFFINNVAAVAIFEKEGADQDLIQCEVRVSVQKNVIASMPMSVNFQGRQRCRTLNVFQGVMVPSIGDISFAVFVGTDLICEWVIPVQAVNLQQSSSPIHQSKTTRSKKQPKD